MTEVVIYTDGACSGNPGPGGWGVVLRWQSKEKELYWIEGTTRRFKDGYNWFGRYPEKVLAFLAKHMK